jgi:alpha-1,6-mannosyltransferase
MAPAKVEQGPLVDSSFILRNWLLLVLGAALALGLALFLYATGLERTREDLEALFFLPFMVYAVAVYWAYTTRERPSRPWTEKAQSRKAAARQQEVVYIILAVAILLRVVFVFTGPSLSDDVYRYYWEGKIGANGINPYIYAPDAQELEKYRDSNWEHINNRDVSSPYPPFAQMTFSAIYMLYPSTDCIWLFKFFSMAFDVVCIYLLFKLLKGFGTDPRFAIIYAWCPLVITNFTNCGHIDSLAVLFMLLSFLALQRGNKMTSAVALALGALTKIFPLLFAPVLFKAWGKKGTALFAGMLGVIYLPYIGAGRALFSGLSIYTDRWFFNGSIFPAIVNVLQSSGLASDRPDAMSITRNALAIVFALVLGYLIYCSRKNYSRPRELFKYAFILTGLFLLITSTVQPWYIIWIIPFLCVFISPSWILLTGTVFLSYHIYILFDTRNIWDEVIWIRLVEYLPFYILLSFEIFYELGVKSVKRTSRLFSMGAGKTEKGAEEE